MKGIVFTEFVEMVDEAFSPEMLEQIIDECNLPSGGAYTSVGTYNHDEIVALVSKLSEKTDTPVNQLLNAFGRHLAVRFYDLYPQFFDTVDSSFAFLEIIESHVHVEVKKLYPDAELPSFDTQRTGDGAMIMTYRSARPFADLAHGLIEGTISHYGENIAIRRSDASGGGINQTEFFLEKLGV